MNYTFHQLQVFVKVCETGSITRASEALFLTQPAVSIQLKKFQDQFDIALTESIGRNIRITEFGKEIEIACQSILNTSLALETRHLKYKGLLAGTLSISVVSTGKYIMPYFINDFVSKHKEVNVKIDVTNKAQVIKSLTNHETEFALVSVVPDRLEVNSEEIMPNQLFLVGSPNNSPEKITKKKLSELAFILREQGSATRNAMEDYLNNMDVKSTSKLELVSNEAVKQAVCAGLGYSILPLIGMKGELELNKIKIIEAPGLPIETTWCLIYLKNRTLSPVGQAYLETLRSLKVEKAANFI